MGTLTVCAVAIRSGAILYYFQYYVGNEKLAASFMVAGTLMSLLGTIAYSTRHAICRKEGHLHRPGGAGFALPGRFLLGKAGAGGADVRFSSAV
jgi:hypothetical protein